MIVRSPGSNPSIHCPRRGRPGRTGRPAGGAHRGTRRSARSRCSARITTPTVVRAGVGAQRPFRRPPPARRAGSRDRCRARRRATVSRGRSAGGRALRASISGQPPAVLDDVDEPGCLEAGGELELMVVDRLAEGAQARHDEGPLAVRQREQDRADAGVRDDDASLRTSSARSSKRQEVARSARRTAGSPTGRAGRRALVARAARRPRAGAGRTGTGGSDGDEDHRRREDGSGVARRGTARRSSGHWT